MPSISTPPSTVKVIFKEIFLKLRALVAWIMLLLVTTENAQRKPGRLERSSEDQAETLTIVFWIILDY